MIVCSRQQAEHYRKEIHKCRKSPAYFLDSYGQIYDATSGEWVPFRLWEAQIHTIRTIADQRLTVILKARQLGLTWLVLGYALWLMLLWPAATVLLFSRRDDEAVDLLGTRLRGMYDRLPVWLKVQSFGVDNDHEWELSNGSRVLAFPTTAGDSYTATLAIVDEADLVLDLDKLMRAVKPTIDGGGRMVLLSRADKTQPLSPFKRIYQAARQGLNGWAPVFLPWYARPERTAAWYEEQKQDIFHRTGALDDLYEQYPATDTEALAPRSLDKRLPAAWLNRCYRGQTPPADLPPGAPSIPGLEVYAVPVPGRRYVVGADPAEGNPQSDDSALTVLDASTGEEAAALAGKFDPTVFASHIDAVAAWYNDAAALVERNNHGHAVLLWLRDNSRADLLRDHDGKDGWNTTSKSKAQLWTTAADAFRGGGTVLHSFATFSQLASIEGATLRAPEGQMDDRAMAYALALQAVVCDVQPELSIRVFNVGPKAVDLGPPRGHYPQLRYFAPHDSWQPMPELNGAALLGCPDFRQESDAALFVVRLFERLGLAPPFAAPEVEDAVRRARVEESLAAFIKACRLCPVAAN